MKESEILSEELLAEQGNYRRVRRWLKGWRSKGLRIMGQQGRETVVEENAVTPFETFEVTQQRWRKQRVAKWSAGYLGVKNERNS